MPPLAAALPSPSSPSSAASAPGPVPLAATLAATAGAADPGTTDPGAALLFAVVLAPLALPEATTAESPSGELASPLPGLVPLSMPILDDASVALPELGGLPVTVPAMPEDEAELLALLAGLSAPAPTPPTTITPALPEVDELLSPAATTSTQPQAVPTADPALLLAAPLPSAPTPTSVAALPTLPYDPLAPTPQLPLPGATTAPDPGLIAAASGAIPAVATVDQSPAMSSAAEPPPPAVVAEPVAAAPATLLAAAVHPVAIPARATAGATGVTAPSAAEALAEPLVDAARDTAPVASVPIASPPASARPADALPAATDDSPATQLMPAPAPAPATAGSADPLTAGPVVLVPVVAPHVPTTPGIPAEASPLPQPNAAAAPPTTAAASATPSVAESVPPAAARRQAAPTLAAVADPAELQPRQAAPELSAPTRSEALDGPARPAATAAPSRPEPNPMERAVAQQVSRAIVQHLPDGGTRLVMRLTPPELGSVRVEFILRDGAMTARLMADDDGVRRALDRALPQIRAEVRGDHPTVDITIDRSEQRHAWHEGHARQERRDEPRGGQRRRTDAVFSLDGVDEAPATRPVPPPVRSLGGRVSAATVDALA